jgi:hypothetical protein
MYCRKCGTPNADNVNQCSQCGESLVMTAAPQQGYAMMPEVPTRLAPAILVTLFCCLPFGIVAIVYAAQVSAKVSAGDYRGATECSDKAKFWCWLAFWLGLIPMVFYIIAMVIAGVAGVASHAPRM